jgi:hypothetical protein
VGRGGLGGPEEKYTPLAARVRARRKHFVSGNSRFLFYFWGAAKLQWAGGGRSAPLGVAMSILLSICFYILMATFQKIVPTFSLGKVLVV